MPCTPLLKEGLKSKSQSEGGHCCGQVSPYTQHNSARTPLFASANNCTIGLALHTKARVREWPLPFLW